jgi:hypothetical protein
MKNIHILPTDKPSRLFKFANELHLDTIPKDYYKKYNIYITDNSKIREGDWFLNTLNNQVNKCDDLIYEKNVNLSSWCKKIILTTDQDLIKDGVQAIDDEFLEWFVKNPSCERVEIESLNIGDDKLGYVICKPQEEPKPHSFCETPDEKCTMNYCDENGCLNRKRELVEVDENKKNLYFKKQVMNPYPVEGYSYTAYEKGFREGYEESNKWKQEQDKVLYDDLIDLLERLRPIYREDSDLHLKYEQKMLDLIEVLKKK